MIDLSWGNAVCVREAFLKQISNNFYLNKEDLLKFNYPEECGDSELLRITREVIKRQTGNDYKHIFLTNGATGGVVISLRALSEKGDVCKIRKAPYYSRYPQMIKAAGLEFSPKYGHVQLLDLPSNPLGELSSFARNYENTIIDGVYFNKVYLPNIPILPDHNILVGSYSKLTGMNGIRIGWIATNDDITASKIKTLIESEYCGLSMSSSMLLKDLLFDFEWSRFEFSAKFFLDCNREMFSKLEKYFNGTKVTDTGMFYYSEMDGKAQELFKKAEVIWTPGSSMGTDNSFARFNLAQDVHLINEAVKKIIKIDTI